ncbi:hypothetical protein DFJ74DRAFT_714694 [Hyaloraphidium curvatum]|nr:hypothetical protein DFJ74DRAFT_714694 [Hyaloraphidium curvatum]
MSTFAVHILVPTVPASGEQPHPLFCAVDEPGKPSMWAPLTAKERNAVAGRLAGSSPHPLKRLVFYAVDPAKASLRADHVARQLDAQSRPSPGSHGPRHALVVVCAPELAEPPCAPAFAEWSFDAVRAAVVEGTARLPGGGEDLSLAFRPLSLAALRMLAEASRSSPPELIAAARKALDELFSPDALPPPAPPAQPCRRAMDELVEVRAAELLARMSLAADREREKDREGGGYHALRRSSAVRRHRRPGSTGSIGSVRSLKLHAHHQQAPKGEPRHKRLAKSLGLKVIIGLPRADRLRRQGLPVPVLQPVQVPANAE